MPAAARPRTRAWTSVCPDSRPSVSRALPTDCRRPTRRRRLLLDSGRVPPFEQASFEWQAGIRRPPRPGPCSLLRVFILTCVRTLVRGRVRRLYARKGWAEEDIHTPSRCPCSQAPGAPGGSRNRRRTDAQPTSESAGVVCPVGGRQGGGERHHARRTRRGPARGNEDQVATCAPLLTCDHSGEHSRDRPSPERLRTVFRWHVA